jgi:ribosomal protein L37AE/L43A
MNPLYGLSICSKCNKNKIEIRNDAIIYCEDCNRDIRNMGFDGAVRWATKELCRLEGDNKSPKTMTMDGMVMTLSDDLI